MIAGLIRRMKGALPQSQVARIDAWLAGASADQLSAGRIAMSAFSLRVLGAAIAYLSQILLARWMGVFEYGVFVVVYVWITILSQIGNLGFSSSVIRFIPEYQARGEIARLRGILAASRLLALGFATLLAAIGAGGVLLFPGVVENHYVIPIVLGAVCLPMFCLTEVQDGIARSFQWSDLAFGPTYIWRPLAILAGMVIAHAADAPMTAATACIAAIAGTWLTAVAQMLLIRRRTIAAVPRDAPHYDLKTWLLVSLPILLSEGFYAILTSVDVIMVSAFGNPEDVAVYYAATKTLALVHFVYYAVRAASGPRFSYHYHAGDQAALRDMVRTSIRWAFWPSVAMAIVVLLLGEALLSLFGSDFVDGGVLLVILVCGILARASIGPVETLLTMAGRQKTCAAAFAVAVVVNVGLNALLIPRYGLIGAAVATTLAMMVETVMVTLAVRWHFGFIASVFRVDDRVTVARRPNNPRAA
ncbi:MAG TPA: lipopolysaccharide biosynthesis protein [Methylomirabilota bacterium]|nr:lipopolysaccharide biosynthesis protein [Methylomirabilota bacterium]